MLRGLLSRVHVHVPSVTPRVRSRTLPPVYTHPHPHPLRVRLFSLSTPTAAGEKPLPPRLKINDADLTISYLKGTGPGGQKINKTNSAVQICHHPTGLVVKSQATRSQSQNEKIARRLLADRVEERHNGGDSRVAIKAERARKKKASKVKKSKRKYRDLEKDQSGELDDQHEDDRDQGSEEQLRGEDKIDGDQQPNQ